MESMCGRPSGTIKPKGGKMSKDINGRIAEPNQLIRVYSEFYITLIDEGILKAERLDKGNVLYLVNWDGGFEIIGNVRPPESPIANDATLPASIVDQLRAKNPYKEALEKLVMRIQNYFDERKENPKNKANGLSKMSNYVAFAMSEARELLAAPTSAPQASSLEGEKRIKELEKGIWQMSLGPQDNDNEWIPYVIEKCKTLLNKKL